MARSRSRKKTSGIPPAELRFIPLGGFGEIGKNMLVFEYGDDLLVVDSGLKFPDEEMFGIDFVIPDVTYLLEKKKNIRGIVLTHGHEDHTGALPFVLPQLDVPLYGTALTLGLASGKLAEFAPAYEPKMREVRAGETIELGAFRVTFVAVCHSIPDGVGLIIETPEGIIVHTGDFKLDPTPIDGRLTDYNAFAEAGKKGVRLLISDSTNAERPGHTPSENIVGKSLEQILRLHRNRRIVVAAFASNIHRTQQVFDAAARFNRKVALLGRSMVSNVELSRKLGYIQVSDDLLVPASEAERVPANRLLVLTTGSQGEPFSGLVLMSKGEHRHILLGQKDLVAIFATPIPGNEKLVSRTIDRLFALGCEVIYDREQHVHASGHASQEELKMMLSIVRPQHFVPFHGERRHQHRHAQLAVEMGVPEQNVHILQNGDILRIQRGKSQVRGTVPSGAVLVDGLAIGEMKGSVLKERRELAEDGILILSIVLDKNGRLSGEIRLESRGFIHSSDATALYEEIRKAVLKVVGSAGEKDLLEPENLEIRIRGRVKEVIRRLTRGTPNVLPMVTILERTGTTA
ncbi:MAG: ribonuclease J [Synergistaceae bacterium]|nr:ribonuclease J [Synergistaceae bacterium]